MSPHNPSQPTASPNPAPADARPHAPWSTPARILAYALMATLALASIWFIDQRVNIPGRNAPTTAPMK